jgi:hypothetical protein
MRVRTADRGEGGSVNPPWHRVQQAAEPSPQLVLRSAEFGATPVGEMCHDDARVEHQSSSGVIVSTGLGSTGWLRSILTGAAGVLRATGGGEPELPVEAPFAWDSDYLCFSVREPSPSKATGASLVFGKVTPEQTPRVSSQMPEHGVIFSDGIESDFLEFNAGMEARIELAQRRGLLVV